MSVGSLSFWQQDRNWRIQQQRWSDQLSSTNLISSVMTSALTRRSAGMASIANHQALVRVTTQLRNAASAALPPGFAGQTGSASSKSSTGSRINKIA